MSTADIAFRLFLFRIILARLDGTPRPTTVMFPFLVLALSWVAATELTADFYFDSAVDAVTLVALENFLASHLCRNDSSKVRLLKHRDLVQCYLTFPNSNSSAIRRVARSLTASDFEHQIADFWAHISSDPINVRVQNVRVNHKRFLQERTLWIGVGVGSMLLVLMALTLGLMRKRLERQSRKRYEKEVQLAIFRRISRAC